MTYYYAVNGQQAGPVSEEELRNMVASGSIPAETPIWREGMADWQPFSVALGGGAAAGAAPTGQAPVVCAVCHQTFPADQTIRYGTVNVCGGCKPRFVQGLREGTVAPGALDYAGFLRRFVAKFVDWIVVGVVNQATTYAIAGTFTMNPATSGNVTAATMSLVTAINFLFGMTYQAWFLHWRGQTPGKMLLGIKVVTPEGGSLSWGKAIVRPLAEILSGCLCFFGYFMVLWDKEKRALHDQLVGTRVIKANK
jgi:uncharacterized RDD family membrane protein YckC